MAPSYGNWEWRPRELKKVIKSWALWHRLVIPALRRLGQEDGEFEASQC
jgi:hypothetical protein